jgi:hypothetical protein
MTKIIKTVILGLVWVWRITVTCTDGKRRA